MSSRVTWLSLHLALGLAWVAVLATQAQEEPSIDLAQWQVAQILFYAGWLPTIATAFWQVKRRRWRDLLFSDLFCSGVLIAVAFSLYVPLFFFNVVWFLPFALLPRGCVTEVLIRTAQLR